MPTDSPLSVAFGDHAARVEAAIVKWFVAGGDMREIAETLEVEPMLVEEVVRRAMRRKEPNLAP